MTEKKSWRGPLMEYQVPLYIRPSFTVFPYQFYTAYRRIVIYEIEYLDHTP